MARIAGIDAGGMFIDVSPVLQPCRRMKLGTFVVFSGRARIVFAGKV